MEEQSMKSMRLGSKIASRRLLRQWPPRRLRSQILNKLLGALWLASPLWKQMQLVAPAAPTRQDLGMYSDMVTAPQPLGLSGPMAQGHLMTVEMQGVDLVLSLVPKMNKHEVLANNTTKGLRSGSIIFGKNPTCHHTTNLSELIAKSARLVFETAKCQDFVARCKDDGIPYAIDSPSAASIQLSLSANPNQLKTERLENNLRLSVENWQISSKVSSLMEMTKVHVSSQRSTLAHMSSAKKIEGMGNLCSNLPLLEVDSCLPLFHLCDGRLFASSPFCRLASRGALFCGCPLRWVLYVVLFDSQSNRA